MTPQGRPRLAALGLIRHTDRHAVITFGKGRQPDRQTDTQTVLTLGTGQQPYWPCVLRQHVLLSGHVELSSGHFLSIRLTTPPPLN